MGRIRTFDEAISAIQALDNAGVDSAMVIPRIRVDRRGQRSSILRMAELHKYEVQATINLVNGVYDVDVDWFYDGVIDEEVSFTAKDLAVTTRIEHRRLFLKIQDPENSESWAHVPKYGWLIDHLGTRR